METAAQTKLDAPLLDSSAADASIEKNALPFVRIATGGGVGWAQEKVMRHTARVSHARFSVDYVRVPGLVLGLDAELQNQERAYATTLPALNGPESLELRENETRVRVGLAGGWDALGSWVAYQDRRLGVLPRLVVSLDQFNNDVVPHTSLGLGAGVSGFVRLAERLRLQTQCTYQYALEIGDKVVQQRLTYGLPISAFRYDAGVVIEVAPRAGLSLGYAGEWLTQERSDRFANSLLLGLILDT